MERHMNTKKFKDISDAASHIEALYKEDKWVVDIASSDEDMSIIIRWVEKKEYTSHTGEVHTDEVWITKNGEMVFVQDLEAEHARNIVRMMLRGYRQQMATLTEQFLENAAEMTGEIDVAGMYDPAKILH